MMYHIISNNSKAGLPRRFAPRNDLSAFTLSEVLITLGIIGIVAAMTMPVLIANYQKQVQVAQIKKVYSTFSQGIKKIMADESCTDLNCVGIFITNMGGTSTLDDKIGRAHV